MIHKVLPLFLLFSGIYCLSSVHTSLYGSSISISWITEIQTNQSIVYYGENRDNLNLNSTGVQSSYSIKSGWNHNVIAIDLIPNTIYYYQCGDPNYQLSDIFSFKTKPVSFTNLSIAVYGDMGTDNSQNTISQLINKTNNNEFDLFLHLGDISYANDHSQEYEKTWIKWFNSMEPIMSKIPYMVSPGNHESVCKALDCIHTTFNFTTFKQKFHMPGNKSNTGTNMFYSFDYGKIHFISISTESDYPGAPPLESDFPYGIENPNPEYYFQVNWLHDDLSNAVKNRNNIPWIIIYGHRPIYAPLLEKNNIPTGYSLRLQEFLEPILKQYSVDLFLNGHVHAYARTYPVYNNTVTSYNYINPPDTVHICAGGAGNIEGISTFPLPLPSWYAGGNDKEFGYGNIIMDDNENSLTWNYYLSNTGELADSFTITKQI